LRTRKLNRKTNHVHRFRGKFFLLFFQVWGTYAVLRACWFLGGLAVEVAVEASADVEFSVVTVEESDEWFVAHVLSVEVGVMGVVCASAGASLFGALFAESPFNVGFVFLAVGAGFHVLFPVGS
jgi:hypothetical protein